ncbi:MAG: rhodanese-like domain-containing protein [candidate division Zixibacteria bacterium]|nr:rhodanese-like domain-containing protein [candidate division Zixibacteria bacterium]
MYIRPNFDKILKQALWIVLFACVVALGYNLFSPKGIPLIGNWEPKVLESGVTVPPSYTPEEDAPVISLAQAYAEFNTGQAIFLDSRKTEEYQAGHIPGALQLYLEEFDTQYELVKDRLPKDSQIIAYCGGDECELSLFVARNLKAEGYTNLKVFFGGWKEWQEAKLPVTKGEKP